MRDETVDTKAPVVPLRRRSREFPAHLPREVVEHKPQDCDCPECGGLLRKLGEDASEMLDYVPGYFRVIRHVRPKLACRACARIVLILAAARFGLHGRGQRGRSAGARR